MRSWRRWLARDVPLRGIETQKVEPRTPALKAMDWNQHKSKAREIELSHKSPPFMVVRPRYPTPPLFGSPFPFAFPFSSTRTQLPLPQTEERHNT